MVAACRNPRLSANHCRPVTCIDLRTSFASAPPVQLMNALMAQPRALTQLGFPRLEAQLQEARYTELQARDQTTLLNQLGVKSYRGDGVSGVLSFFCDDSGASCVGCQHLRSEPAYLVDRASAKRARLQKLASTMDVNSVFKKQRLDTLVLGELLLKVSTYTAPLAMISVVKVQCLC